MILLYYIFISGNGVVSFPTSRWSSYWKGSLRVILNWGCQLLTFIYSCIYHILYHIIYIIKNNLRYIAIIYNYMTNLFILYVSVYMCAHVFCTYRCIRCNPRFSRTLCREKNRKILIENEVFFLSQWSGFMRYEKFSVRCQGVLLSLSVEYSA